MKIVIRDEEPRDYKAVYQVVSSAFGRRPEAELVKDLRAGGHSVISLVADEGGQILGHVLLSKIEASFPALALAPLSVVPPRQRSGIGSALVEGSVNRARSQGWGGYLRLG
jgi:putative acetyltransferase